MALIGLTDLQKIRPISVNIDDLERLIPFIEEAEQVDLSPFLGDALMYDMISHLTQQRYKDLLNGVVYTHCGNPIKFPGLKTYLAYMGYARFLDHQQINVTAFGVVHKKNEPFSEPVPLATIVAKVASARLTASNFQTAAVKFLNEKHAIYTLWKCTDSPERRTSVRISNVSRF